MVCVWVSMGVCAFAAVEGVVELSVGLGLEEGGGDEFVDGVNGVVAGAGVGIGGSG
jgi:hypothetical protein